jgi:hypothetical protein
MLQIEPKRNAITAGRADLRPRCPEVHPVPLSSRAYFEDSIQCIHYDSHAGSVLNELSVTSS